MKNMKKLVLLSLLALGLTPAIFAGFGDVLVPTAIGAGIGGAAGGGRGAAIGAGVGFGVGVLGEASRHDRDYYGDDYGYERPSQYRRVGTYYRQPVYQQPYYDDAGRRIYPNFDPMDID